VAVNCNDPATPFVTLGFTANVKQVWSFEPHYIKFQLNPEGTATIDSAITFSLNNHHSIPINYIDIRSNIKEITITDSFPKTEAALEPGRTFTCTLLPNIEQKLEGTKYGYVDVKIIFKGGRTFSKRIGASLNRWRKKKS